MTYNDVIPQEKISAEDDIGVSEWKKQNMEKLWGIARKEKGYKATDLNWSRK